MEEALCSRPGGEGVSSSLGSHGVARGSGWLGRQAHGSFCNNRGEGGTGESMGGFCWLSGWG